MRTGELRGAPERGFIGLCSQSTYRLGRSFVQQSVGHDDQNASSSSAKGKGKTLSARVRSYGFMRSDDEKEVYNGDIAISTTKSIGGREVYVGAL